VQPPDSASPVPDAIDERRVEAEPIASPPPEVAEFIRFCHKRRPRAWPDLYDEMWVVAARREFNGWGFEQLEAYGVTFSLFEMPRLAGWVREVLAGLPDAPEPVLVGPLGT
jgi:hypothetical protein